MKYDWIIDVLADLKTFAQGNGLLGLAEHLDETSHVAATDIAHAVGGQTGKVTGDARQTRTDHRELAEGKIA